MGIRNLSEDIVLVTLSEEPQLNDELKNLNEMVSNRCDFDVIVDFSRVETVTSPSISNLIILRQWLRGSGHKLILCRLAFPTKCIFKLVGLEAFFDFADDEHDALTAIQAGTVPTHSSLTENPAPAQGHDPA